MQQEKEYRCQQSSVAAIIKRYLNAICIDENITIMSQGDEPCDEILYNPV
jgi:hypothetical protein